MIMMIIIMIIVIMIMVMTIVLIGSRVQLKGLRIHADNISINKYAYW